MKRAIFTTALLVAACNQDQTGTQPQPPITSDAAVPILTTPPRTVMHRNPFGDVLQHDNLMIDGDFEITGRSDQAPWVAFNTTAGQTTLNYDTGGHCRSGVRCGVIGVGDALIGYLATPLLGNFEVRLYIRPEGDHCADATVLVFDTSTQQTGDTIAAVEPAPRADGWCYFEGVGKNLAYGQPALYVELSKGSKSAFVRIDEASVLPVTEAPAHQLKLLTTAPVDQLARADVAAKWMREHRKLGNSTPRSIP